MIFMLDFSRNQGFGAKTKVSSGFARYGLYLWIVSFVVAVDKAAKK
jgi:hypothetical protein